MFHIKQKILKKKKGLSRQKHIGTQFHQYGNGSKEIHSNYQPQISQW